MNKKIKKEKMNTIILSCYNGTDLIKDYVHSLLCKEIMDTCTLIAVNFPFSHQDPAWVEEQLQKYPDLVLIDSEEDLSLYEAWNLGLEAAKTKYVSTLNLDDRVSKDYYRYGLNKLETLDADVFSTFSVMTSRIGEISADVRKQCFADPTSFGHRDVIEYDISELVKFENGRLVKNNIPHCAPIWRRSIHRELGYFDSKKFDFCADYEFWLRAAAAGKKLIVSKEEKTLFYCAQGTASDRILHPENTKIIDFWKPTFPPPHYRPSHLGQRHDLLHHCMNMNVIFSSPEYYKHLENSRDFQHYRNVILGRVNLIDDEGPGKETGTANKDTGSNKAINKQRLQQFKDLHKGERCILMCNGPSLNKVDFSKIDKEKFTFFGLNKIYLGFDRMGFEPDYLVAVNKKVLEQAADEYNKLPLVKFIGSRAEQSLIPEGPSTFRINTTDLPPRPKRFSPDISEYVHEGWTVTNAALQIIYYMGFSEVYIVGMDHRFSQHIEGQENKEATIKADDVDHFHPQYFGHGQSWDYPDLRNSEISYAEALRTFLEDGRKIFDCTIDGACDIFPKMDINDLYELTVRPKPLVSIIMPVYNAEPFLGRAIESVQAQDCEDWELLIIDDGSGDESMTTAGRYAERDSRLRLLKNPKKGVSSARNHGLALARGHYIGFLDADDLYYEKSISGRLRVLQYDLKKQVCYTETAIIDQNGMALDWLLGKKELVSFENMSSFPVHISALLVRSSALKDLCFDEDLTNGEDWLFFTALAAKVKHFFKAPEGSSGYRCHGASVVKKDYYGHVQKLQMVIERIYRIKDDLVATNPQSLSQDWPDKEDLFNLRKLDLFAWAFLEKNEEVIEALFQDSGFCKLIAEKSIKNKLNTTLLNTAIRYYACHRAQVPLLLYNNCVIDHLKDLKIEDHFPLFYALVQETIARALSFSNSEDLILLGPFERPLQAFLDETAFIAGLFSESLKGSVMIDVGAFHGASLLPFLKKGWRIFAFEPDQKNRLDLKERLQQKDNASLVCLDPRAVSNASSKQVGLYRSKESPGISALSPFHPSHREAQQVETVTLKEALKPHDLPAVDYLKIDTEGHDLFVLQGFPWERFKPAVIECEFEDSKTLPLGYSWQDLAEFLYQRGYSVYVSEWHPIIVYGIKHDWRQLLRYPCALGSKKAWGNLLAFRDPIDQAWLIKVVSKYLETAPLVHNLKVGYKLSRIDQPQRAAKTALSEIN